MSWRDHACTLRCAIISAACLALLSACASSSPAEPLKPGAPSAEAPREGAATRHLGEWVMAPPPGQEREVLLVRLALATPPDSEAFEAMDPSSREREHFSNVLRLRREEPASPMLEALQRKLDELEGVRVTFLADKFMVTTKGGSDWVSYRIEENLGSRLVILEDGTGPEHTRRKILSFDGSDRMVITSGPTRIPMMRVPDGTVPAPSEVPSEAPPPPSQSADAPNDSAPIPPSGNQEYDACVAAYYACVDRMPASERTAMADMLAYTKKIFADAQGDPERMKSALSSCKQAVALGKATFCP